MSSLTTRVIRSGEIESFHSGYGVVTDAAGKIIRSYGDPHYSTYMRSSAKPLQAMAVLRSGAFEDLKLSDQELALICSSHSGEPVHIQTAESIFAKAGLSPELLRCGVHPPIHKESAEALRDSGQKPQQIHNNCSGKHVGMLCTCVQMGYDPDDYLDPSHPVQTYIYDIVKEYTSAASIHRGVDGCSAPVFYLPLSKLAQSFAMISSQETAERKKIFKVMTSYPQLVGGTGRFDTSLMQGYPGQIISKGGAEAVSAAGFIMPDGQVYGLAVKVLDGNYRAIGQMVLKMLEDIDFLRGSPPEDLDKWWIPEIKNHAKYIVGTTETMIES